MKEIPRCLVRRKRETFVKERVHGLSKNRGIVRILPLVLQELKIEVQKPFKKPSLDQPSGSGRDAEIAANANIAHWHTRTA